MGGLGNLSSNPQFVDADGQDNNPSTYEDNNYRLQGTSSCVDTGQNEPWMFGEVDLDENNRVFQGKLSASVDMGAYEFGSFRFEFAKVEKTSEGRPRLTWISRPGDTYVVLSRSGEPGWGWVNEAIVPSQGMETVWTAPGALLVTTFYRIELK